MTQDRLRLRKNPSNVAVPQGSEDLYFDASGNLIHESPAGVKETLATQAFASAVAGADIHYDKRITGITGGGATKLDGITTVGVTTGRIQLVVATGDQAYFYRLTSSTSAESLPNVVRADDYNDSTNQKVWVLQGISSSSISAQTIAATTITASESISIGNTGVIQGNNLTDERINEMADADGELALATQGANYTPATGSTITAARYVDSFIYAAPAGTIAALTLALPALADCRDGQTITFFSTQIITAITVTAGSGNTMGGTTLSAVVANTAYSFIYVAAVSKWVRIA